MNPQLVITSIIALSMLGLSRTGCFTVALDSPPYFGSGRPEPSSSICQPSGRVPSKARKVSTSGTSLPCAMAALTCSHCLSKKEGYSSKANLIRGESSDGDITLPSLKTNIAMLPGTSILRPPPAPLGPPHDFSFSFTELALS
ncbi:hypothetical protein D9M71_727110 [compost metagenome]